MRNRTLEDLILGARELGDQVNSTFVSDAELTLRVNQRIAQLYDMLCAADSDRYATVTTVSTTSSSSPAAWYAELPEDFYMLRGVDLHRGSSRYPLEPFALQERETDGEYGAAPIRYRIANSAIDGDTERMYFDRNPGNSTFTLYYIPAAPELAQDDDELNGFNGWEDWVMFKVAIDMLNKEESDSSALQLECAQIEQRIKLLSTMRDAGRAPAVADVRSGYSYRRIR